MHETGSSARSSVKDGRDHACLHIPLPLPKVSKSRNCTSVAYNLLVCNIHYNHSHSPPPIIQAIWHCNLIHVCTSILYILWFCNDGRGSVYQWVHSSENTRLNEVTGTQGRKPKHDHHVAQSHCLCRMVMGRLLPAM